MREQLSKAAMEKLRGDCANCIALFSVWEVARMVQDKPAVTKPRSWNIDEKIRLAGSALAVLTLILAVVGFVRREDFEPALIRVSLGREAIAS